MNYPAKEAQSMLSEFGLCLDCGIKVKLKLFFGDNVLDLFGATSQYENYFSFYPLAF